jgi:WD40 repeat protein
MLSSGDRLIVASQDRSLRLYDVPAREQVLEIGTGAKPVIAASLSDATDVLATVALDNCVRFWDLGTGRELAALWGASGESFIGIATRGTSITVCLADGRIRLWQTE